MTTTDQKFCLAPGTILGDHYQIIKRIGKYLFPNLDGLQKVHESGIIHRDIKGVSIAVLSVLSGFGRSPYAAEKNAGPDETYPAISFGGSGINLRCLHTAKSGYKPIVFENGRFVVKNPIHSACAVLMVTGYGAEAYAMHYDLRLPSAREWFFVMQTSNTNSGKQERMPLPTPVINYAENAYGLRGVNQLAEWGKNRKDEFVILGQAPSEMVEVDFIETKNPVKYYTDTGFRVALDLPS